MEDLYRYIGNKIRAYREAQDKMSQERLAELMDTTANTISRWETGVYHPTVVDLDNLARIFGIGLWSFFPSNIRPPTEAQQALLSATGDLPEEDLEELRRYADFIRARKVIKQAKGQKKGAKSKSKSE